MARCTQGNCTNGYGTYNSANGAKYVGEFKDGEKHGQGVFIDASKLRLEWYGLSEAVPGGLWEMGRLVMTQAELDAEQAAEKYKRIYNACLLDRALTEDMSVASIETAVKETCAAKPHVLLQWATPFNRAPIKSATPAIWQACADRRGEKARC